MTPTPVPGPPDNVTAVAGNTSATISWSAPAVAGGSAINSYSAVSSPEGKSCQTSGALSCVVGGLTNGATYTFTVTAGNLSGPGPASLPSNAVTPRASSTFHPITPVRLLDTRSNNGLSGKLSANSPRTFQVAGRLTVPANAVAVTGNVTVVNSTNGWAVYLGPVATAAPATSTVNFGKGQVVGNGLTVSLSGTGMLSATFMSTAGSTTDLVFDVTGYFTSDTTGATYHAMTPVDSSTAAAATGCPASSRPRPRARSSWRAGTESRGTPSR